MLSGRGGSMVGQRKLPLLAGRKMQRKMACPRRPTAGGIFCRLLVTGRIGIFSAKYNAYPYPYLLCGNFLALL